VRKPGGPGGWDDALVRERPTGRTDQLGRPARVFDRPTTGRDRKVYSRPDVAKLPKIKQTHSMSKPKHPRGSADKRPDFRPPAQIKNAQPKSKDKKVLKIEKANKSTQKVRKSGDTEDRAGKLSKVRIAR
jgi:hypothetical protein